MPRDFAKKTNSSRGKKRTNRRPSKRQNKTQAPGWLWLVTGVLVGAFIMFLLHLNGLTPSQQEPISQSETTRVETAPPSTDQAEEGIPEQRLQFYELLKESTVEVPQPDPAELAANNPTRDILYVLQAGSFKHSEDANRMRAEIILMNLSASVEPAGTDPVWYRVMVGPFDNRSRMAKARSILVSNNINPLVLKRDRPPQ